MKGKTGVLLILIMLAAAITACGKDANDQQQIIITTGFEEDELFFIGDNKCYMPEARLYIRTLETSYEDMFGTEIMSRELNGINVSDKLTGLALSRLAQVKAMNLLAAERGLTLTEREEEKCVQAADRYMRSLSEADIRDLDIDYDMLLHMFEEYALADKVYNDITGDINPEISDDEARTITVKVIAVDGKDQAEALQIANMIYSQVSDGRDLDAAADEYEEATVSKYSFGKDTDEFPEDFVDTCFKLAADEISTPIMKDNTAYIVQCISSFEQEDTDANKLRIIAKRKSEAFDQVYNDFVSGLYSNFNDTLWDDQMFLDRRLDSTDDFFRVYEDVFSLL
ncbi:MAG: peptidylprolyl isomerase [Lachnospiraceae bacterium]|nr:peptidylprolyl isomerase [Lachnospiraceae bacterium]